MIQKSKKGGLFAHFDGFIFLINEVFFNKIKRLKKDLIIITFYFNIKFKQYNLHVYVYIKYNKIQIFQMHNLM